jgi:hypothetical protein
MAVLQPPASELVRDIVADLIADTERSALCGTRASAFRQHPWLSCLRPVNSQGVINVQSRSLKFAMVLAVLSTAGTAVAAPNCTSEPKSKWLPEAAMQEQIAKLGYKVKVFKVSGNCYEIYGWTREGAKVEVYFNPVTGEAVKSEIEGH